MPGPLLMMKFVKLEAALIVLLAVVAVAFFPAMRGPYSATHGPVSTPRTRSLNFLDRLKSSFASIRGDRTQVAFDTRLNAPAALSAQSSKSISVLRI